MSDGSTIATYNKCHASATYEVGREAAVSLTIYGSETDYVMLTAEPTMSQMVFCKYTPSGI